MTTGLPELGGLPDRMRSFLRRTLPPDVAAPAQVCLTQTGEMWQKPGGRALRFDAVERIAVDRVAFDWRARFPLVGPLALSVVDGYADGEGALTARLLGVPLLRRRGSETTLGEVLRYLAELPWAPFAVASNPELAWRRLADDAVEVSTTLGEQRPAVELRFDAAGDIVGASSTMRPLERDGVWQPTPWGGVFGDYRTLGGVRIPARAEVYWDLPEGRHVYWRGTVTGVELPSGPFASTAPMTR